MTSKLDEHETGVVEQMSAAHAIAKTLFMNRVSTFAVEQIYDWLEISPSEEEFATDLKRVIEHTKIVYETTAPTPEQVFGVFERIFGEEE